MSNTPNIVASEETTLVSSVNKHKRLRLAKRDWGVLRPNQTRPDQKRIVCLETNQAKSEEKERVDTRTRTRMRARVIAFWGDLHMYVHISNTSNNNNGNDKKMENNTSNKNDIDMQSVF